MATERLVEKAPKGNGPSGFLQVNAFMLVVDYGNIYMDGAIVGYLHEDGLILGSGEPLGKWEGLRSIDEVPGCVFQGIDASGATLELPGKTTGPTGGLWYNEVPLNVINGRISTQNHNLVGTMNDAGVISLRCHKDRNVMLEMDEQCQLNTRFQGIKSDGKPFQLEWIRPLHRKDRTYSDNEIIRYFKLDFDKLNTAEKKYVLESMKLWASCGLLQVVRKTQGDAAFGNVKHGASGVTGLRTGTVTVDREEFEREIVHYKKYGALAVVSHQRVRPYAEVRLNLVVAHEYGHQLEFTLSQAANDRITQFYEKRRQQCDRLHPLPEEYEGQAELLLIHQIEERIFISGYARSSMHEYWAEATAAFSVKESRNILKQCDKAIHDLLHEIVFTPETMLSPSHEKDILKLQTSLRVGGEMSDDILDRC